MPKGTGKPNWFKMFVHNKPILDAAPDEAVGKAVKAIMAYCESGTMPEGGEAMVQMLFYTLKIGVDESFNDYGKNVENGRKGGRPKADPLPDQQEEAPKEEPKPVKHKHGEYNNVLLTDEELTKLQAEFPDWKARIERLSVYMASKGTSYKSHYATIRAWARKDAEQPGQPMRAQHPAENQNPFLQYVQDQERGEQA